MHSAQVMSQMTPLEVDILFHLCDVLHQSGWVGQYFYFMTFSNRFASLFDTFFYILPCKLSEIGFGSGNNLLKPDVSATLLVVRILIRKIRWTWRLLKVQFFFVGSDWWSILLIEEITFNYYLRIFLLIMHSQSMCGTHWNNNDDKYTIENYFLNDCIFYILFVIFYF